jgi:hypothetical protein
MKYLEISLEMLQNTLEGSASSDSCKAYFDEWSRLKTNGRELLNRLDKHLSNQDNYFSQFFPSFISATESWFHEGFSGRSNQNYNLISPIVVAMYDLLISLKRSYENKSAVTCGMITRAIFEARLNLCEMSKDPDRNATQYTKFKDVARLWNEYRSIENPSNEDIEGIKLKLKNYPEWYDTDWKTMKSKRNSWTGISNDNMQKMAKRNELEDEYEALYKITSLFVHVSPLLSNYYSVHGNGPICNEKGVAELSYIALSHYNNALKSALDVIAQDADLVFGALNVPLIILAREINM